MTKYLASASFAVLALFAPISTDHYPDSLRASIGMATANAQSAVAVDKITITAGGVVITIPQMTVEGSPASEADIRAIFAPQNIDQLSSRFKALSARRVTIPEIEIRQKLPDGVEGVTVYKDTTLTGINDGLIGEVVSRLATTKSSAPKPAAGGKPDARPGDIPQFIMDMTMADMVMKGLNLTLMARFLTDKAAAGEQLTTALAEQTVGKTVMTIDKVKVTIDRLAMQDFKVRPLSKPLMETVATLENRKNDRSDAAEKDSLIVLRDFLGAMSFGNMEANGMAIEFPDENRKTARITMDKMRMSGGGDVPGHFSLLGHKMEFSDYKINLGEFTLAGMRFPELSASLDKLAAGGSKSDLKPEALFPTIEQFRLAGIDLDVPDTKEKGKRLKAKLGEFDIRMGNHVGPIPANVGMKLDRFQMDIPTNTSEKGLKDILALGYKAVDVSMRYDQVWDQASKVLKLNELSMSSAGMFSAMAKAELGNFPREAFTMDKAVASVAALGVIAKNLSVSIKNDSLFEKLIAQQATAQKRKPEDLRAELAAGATLMVPMFMGDHPGAKLLGEALGKFLADPKNLTVELTAQGNGLGAVDFLAVKDPTELLKKVDIKATANQ